MLSVTTAGHSALLTSIILPIPSGVTPHKCLTGSSHLCPAATSNSHVCSSLGHSPLPIKWHYLEKVLEFTFPMSMVIQWFSSCPVVISSTQKCFRENVLKRVYLTFSSGLLSSACAKTQLSEVVLSVSAPLHQLASGSHCSCFRNILRFFRAPLGSAFGSVFLNMERACSISSQLQAAVCLSTPLWCLSDWCSKKTQIVLKKIQ